MAILISSIALFGLSLFDIQQRYREIAIRKVHGATHKEILLLLLKKYIIILAMSFLIAISISYWGITIYLKDFAYKANISSLVVHYCSNHHIINFHINIGLSSKKGCTTESGGSNQK